MNGMTFANYSMTAYAGASEPLAPSEHETRRFPTDCWVKPSRGARWRGVWDEFRNWLRLGLQAREKE